MVNYGKWSYKYAIYKKEVVQQIANTSLKV